MHALKKNEHSKKTNVYILANWYKGKESFFNTIKGKKLIFNSLQLYNNGIKHEPMICIYDIHWSEKQEPYKLNLHKWIYISIIIKYSIFM